MDRTKLIAFLLMVGSLGAILLAGDLAVGPFLLVRIGQYPGGVPPGCMAVAMIVIFLPIAGVPGAVGLILWRRSVRRRELEDTREVASWPDEEETLQVCYERLIVASLDGTAEASLLSLNRVADQLSPLRRDRWRRFLAASGVPEIFFLPSEQEGGAERATISESGIRFTAFVMSLIGFFCLLWALLVALGQIFTNASRSLGVAASPESALIGASGCLVPGITAVTGGLGLIWLLRNQRRRRAVEKEWRSRACEILLAGCIRNLEQIVEGGLIATAHTEIVGKLARASIFDALSELDEVQKGCLVVAIHARGLSRNLFQGSNLKRAKLKDAELSGATLVGADFTGGVLAGACLEKADLRDCRFVEADLRTIAACGADFRHCDLRGAWLHRSDLRHADLRNTDLRGANLWKANLRGADLRGTFVSIEQLKSAESTEGSLLPFDFFTDRDTSQGTGGRP